MAKDKETKKRVEQMREDTLKKFFGLSDKLYRHIESSMTATKPCTACRIGDGGKNIPIKAAGPDGLCAFCHGTYIVPDTEQRNWAAERLQTPLVSAAPKQVEMAVEQTSVIPEVAETAKQLPDGEIDAMLRRLGVGGNHE